MARPQYFHAGCKKSKYYIGKFNHLYSADFNNSSCKSNICNPHSSTNRKIIFNILRFRSCIVRVPLSNVHSVYVDGGKTKDTNRYYSNTRCCEYWRAVEVMVMVSNPAQSHKYLRFFVVQLLLPHVALRCRNTISNHLFNFSVQNI